MMDWLHHVTAMVDHSPFLDAVNDWSMVILLWVGTPIQVLFVVLFLTRKWRKYRFSRAVMWKSSSLALYMYAGWSKLFVAGLRNYDWPWWIDLQTPIINTFVFWAIVNQLAAILTEILVGDKNPAETEVTEKLGDEMDEAEQ